MTATPSHHALAHEGSIPGGATRDEAALVRVARLDGPTSQQVFRALLAALARPGVPVDLPTAALAPGSIPNALLLPLALGDVDTTHAVIGAGPWSRVVAAATSSRPVDVAAADLVTGLSPPSDHDLCSLRIGSADAPERGARLALAVERLTTGPDDAAVTVHLRGPGVDGEATVGVDGLDPRLLVTLAARNAAYPAGIDTWLVSDTAVVGLPRSTTITAVRPTGRAAPSPGGEPTAAPTDTRGGQH